VGHDPPVGESPYHHLRAEDSGMGSRPPSWGHDPRLGKLDTIILGGKGVDKEMGSRPLFGVTTPS